MPPYRFHVWYETRYDFATYASDSKVRFHSPHVIRLVLNIFFLLWRADSKISGFAAEFAGCGWAEAVSGKKKFGINNILIRVDGALV